MENLKSPDRTFTLEEVTKHNKEGDAWIVVDSFVYDISKFAKLHPGGRDIILKYAGRVATDAFKLYHNMGILVKYHPRLCIGSLAPADCPPERPIRLTPEAFGDMIPYSDPAWYQRFRQSPYYRDSHRALRATMREWTDRVLMPLMPHWADNTVKEPPREVSRSLAGLGALCYMTGMPYPAKFAPPGAPAPPEDLDYFHELIIYDELARCGNPAALAALTNGPAIALSAVLFFGTEEQQRLCCPPVLAGEEFVALAISEPYAGSDVAGLQCRAVDRGDYYEVTGQKKWITNGTYAKWFVTAVRTGPEGSGQGGLSFLLVDRDTPGFTIRKVNIRNSDLSGTAYLMFDGARVPKDRLIGKENNGFKMIMYNFNHERWYLVVCCVRLARVCIEECIKYASRRHTFGRPLHQHQAVRMKVARMARQTEALSHWLEAMTYQMSVMPKKEAMLALGDQICLMKAHASKVYEEVASLTTHIFGGNALYQDGVGKRIEAVQLAVKGYSIPGGAEDILEDFAARQAFRQAISMARM
eukprot:TRINITY_DN14597_c0_g1_i1.p1 TRINITY_DN14597_c0_g1~~TRINITY_DN14597_c0_g1_i1.p1  ORF type:complete len:545 (+),score=124.06 TRINITY_DN14597_c0_g1_i1:54-1637(+)